MSYLLVSGENKREFFFDEFGKCFCLQDGKQLVRVNQDTRLNFRVLDLRTPANQAIFHLSSEVEHVRRSCRFFGYSSYTENIFVFDEITLLHSCWV